MIDQATWMGRPIETMQSDELKAALKAAVRLLRSALDEATLSLPRAILLVDYHIRRNETARASHEKAWRAKHGEKEDLLL